MAGRKERARTDVGSPPASASPPSFGILLHINGHMRTTAEVCGGPGAGGLKCPAQGWAHNRCTAVNSNSNHKNTWRTLNHVPGVSKHVVICVELRTVPGTWYVLYRSLLNKIIWHVLTYLMLWIELSAPPPIHLLHP